MKQMQENPPENIQAPKKSGILETVRFILISLILVLGFRYFIAQPFIVSGDSMVPTFENGDYLVVDEISYRFGDPKRSDVIIMRYPLDPKKYFIKRIIGLPGETVVIEGTMVTITTAGGEKIVLSEPYVTNKKSDHITVKLKDTEYYVLGDNRAASSDSRRWGPLPQSNIIGKPIIRLLPLSEISWAPGAQQQ